MLNYCNYCHILILWVFHFFHFYCLLNNFCQFFIMKWNYISVWIQCWAWAGPRACWPPLGRTRAATPATSPCTQPPRAQPTTQQGCSTPAWPAPCCPRQPPDLVQVSQTQSQCKYKQNKNVSVNYLIEINVYYLYAVLSVLQHTRFHNQKYVSKHTIIH